MTAQSGAKRPREVPILLDKPAANAALFDRQIDMATSIITSHAADGLTMAVYGPWGSGKTRVLNGIKKRIAGVADIETIDFDAWRYDRTGDVDAMLAKKFDSSFKLLRGDDKSAFGKSGIGALLGNMGWDLGSATASTMLDPKALLIGILLMGGGKIAEKLAERRGEAQDDGQDDELLKTAADLLTSDDYFEGFATISRAFEEKGKSIVVFLDDLDRCDPDTIASVVSSLHVVMRQPRISFVLALDHDYLVNAITKQFDSWFPAGEGDDFAERYLEKIIQVSISVPTLNTSLVGQDEMIEDRNRKLFRALVNEGDAYGGQGSGPTSRTTLLSREVAKYGEYGINPGAKPGSSSARPFELFMDRIVPLALRNNPRQMKRFLNSYVLSVNTKWEYVHAREDDAIGIECDLMRLLGLRFLDRKSYTELERRLSRGWEESGSPADDRPRASGDLGTDGASDLDSGGGDGGLEGETLQDVLSHGTADDLTGRAGLSPDVRNYVDLTGMGRISLRRARELFDMLSTTDGSGSDGKESSVDEQQQSNRGMAQAKLVPLVREYPELLESLSDKERAQEVVARYTGGKSFRSWFYPPFSKSRDRSKDNHPRYLRTPVRLGPDNEAYYFSTQWYARDIPIVDEFCERYREQHPNAEE